ncbi:unnamed protein product [Linum tenue]|uniref:S-protein homolog n=1 Tax=Linum tenue TaxID=586396 RepID=A0AAV0N4Y9_9ROSI|nr:unnamed protein product [Linum tenue]
MFVIAILVLLPHSSAAGIGPSHYVHVENHLSDPRAKLLVHCKSADDDLGVHYIAVNNEFQWHFHSAFMKMTLFWCHLKPSNQNGRHVDFDAYRNSLAQIRREYRYHSYWIVKDDGVYSKMKNDRNQWVEWLQFPWQ